MHRIEVIEVAPEFLEAVRGRQRVDVVAEMVLAELAGVVAEIEQELGKMRRSGPYIGRAAGKFRQDHADADRLHAGDEGRSPGSATLLGVIVHELGTFIADAIDVGRLADHQPLMVDAGLHPADVIAHDEQDVGLLSLLSSRRCAERDGRRHQHRCAQEGGTRPLEPTNRRTWPRSEWLLGECRV